MSDQAPTRQQMLDLIFRDEGCGDLFDDYVDRQGLSDEKRAELFDGHFTAQRLPLVFPESEIDAILRDCLGWNMEARYDAARALDSQRAEQ